MRMALESQPTSSIKYPVPNTQYPVPAIQQPAYFSYQGLILKANNEGKPQNLFPQTCSNQVNIDYNRIIIVYFNDNLKTI